MQIAKLRVKKTVGKLSNGEVGQFQGLLDRGDEWSLGAFVSMPSTAIFL